MLGVRGRIQREGEVVHLVAYKLFDRDAGDAIAALDALPIINAFTKALQELSDQTARREGAAEQWLRSRVTRLAAPSETPPSATDGASSDDGAT